MQKEMGKHYYGLRLGAASVDDAIYDGVLMQMTINTHGRLMCVLQNADPDKISMQYDSNMLFETSEDAAAFWDEHHAEFMAIEKEFADAAKVADEKKNKIIGDAQFAILVQQ